ncbi:MAG: ATP-grasp domain-containing protein [Rubripirellula sp.]
MHHESADDPASRRVLMIGASVRAAAQSASAGGYRVVGMDQFGDRDAVAACDEFAMLDDVDRVGELLGRYADVPLIQVGGLSEIQDWLGIHPAARARLSPSIEIQRQLADPSVLARLASENGFSFPETLESTNDPSTDPSTDQIPLGRWLCKPRHGSGGIGIRWLDRSRPPKDGWIQRWVSGRSFGATLLVRPGASQLLGVCRSTFHRISTAADSVYPFVYGGSMGPIACDPGLADRLVSLGHAIGEHAIGETSGLAGLCNVDFMVDQNQTPWLIEINPRWSGSSELIQQGLEITSLMALAINQNQKTPFQADAPPKDAILKKVVFARVGFRFHLKSFADGLPPAVQIADIPADGAEILAGWPVCSLIGKPSDVVRASRKIGRQFAILSGQTTAAGR